VSRDQKLDEAMASCNRFLSGHGPRRVSDLLATIPPDSAIDYYGVGGVVATLEERVASLLGKPAALFLPSGTMAQQIVLRVHGERRGAKSVAFHPFCHLDSHEERGYQQLHDLFAIPVGPRNEPLSAANLSLVHQPVGSLLIELPQRDLGGVLPSWRELNAQINWAREREAATHLDGARLWESTPFYRKTPAQIAALFDTVYVSFYKGLGGITGCCVAGERDVIDEVSTWRTRHGGRLYGMWPYAASALTVLDQRLPRMGRYYRRAVAIGAALEGLPGVDVIPTKIQAPMMHLRLHVTLDELRARALEIARTDKVWTFARAFTSEDEHRQRIEFTVGDATLEFSPDEIRHYVRRLVKKAPPRASSR
jgi:threonine aldolase